MRADGRKKWQNIANSTLGIAPFFNKGTSGAEVHPRILEAAAGAPIIVKEFAGSFVNTNLVNTNLEETLNRIGATGLLVCGMMTQNCVTHTAVSKSAEKSILTDCSTTVTELLHNTALHAVSTRLPLALSDSAL
ncbi:MAG: isochorismatase family protein [Nitrospirae bacterium]|nr:isochorismatase family protein [Nitrospirota bacterium]